MISNREDAQRVTDLTLRACTELAHGNGEQFWSMLHPMLRDDGPDSLFVCYYAMAKSVVDATGIGAQVERGEQIALLAVRNGRVVSADEDWVPWEDRLALQYVIAVANQDVPAVNGTFVAILEAPPEQVSRFTERLASIVAGLISAQESRPNQH